MPSRAQAEEGGEVANESLNRVQQLAGGTGEANAGNRRAGDAFDPSLDIDLKVICAPFQKGARQSLRMALAILETDVHGKTLERLEVAIALQQLTDSRTADFKHIGFTHQG